MSDAEVVGALAMIILVLAGGSGLVWVIGTHTVDEKEWGLDQNTWNKEIDYNKVYGAGRHHLGVWHKFIIFPKTMQTIEFADENIIKSRTQDGLAVSLEISFQYQLVKDHIPSLYKELAEDYHNHYWRLARDSVRDTASFYDAIEFFHDRTEIGSIMEIGMYDTILPFHSVVINFQLRAIDLPDSFEDALERAEVARQEIEIASFEQEAARIKAETLIIEAQADANITLIAAAAGAEAFLITIEAQAKAINMTLSAEREAYYAFAQTLNMTASELLAYLWIQAILEHDESMLIIGENTPDLILNTNTTLAA